MSWDRNEYQRVWMNGFNSGKRLGERATGRGLTLADLMDDIAALPDERFDVAWRALGAAIWEATRPPAKTPVAQP